MRPRSGFTLLELLTVLGLLVLLSSVVVVGVAGTRGGDRTATAARNLQAQILGARDRATHFREHRGVRLLRDPAQPGAVAALVAIQPLPRLRYGGPTAPIQLERLDVAPADGRADSPAVLVIRGLSAGVDWLTLQQQGHLATPFRLRIPAGTGAWHTVEQLSADPQRPGETIARLAVEFGEGDPGRLFDQVIAIPADSTRATCELDLGYEQASPTAVEAFPAGVVIDLHLSRIPDAWRNSTATLDLIYSPRGGLTGVVQGGGPVSLVLRDQRDVDRGLDPADPRCASPAIGVSLSPQTGAVETFPIDPTDLVDNTTQASGPDGRADDLFRFAHARSGANP